jgi:hypothetical protein
VFGGAARRGTRCHAQKLTTPNCFGQRPTDIEARSPKGEHRARERAEAPRYGGTRSGSSSRWRAVKDPAERHLCFEICPGQYFG